jgi:RNA recognition motif. (a.k.a. RRM, RBD, or RNP domain)
LCLAPWMQLQEADQVTRHLWIGGLAPGVDRTTLINVAQAFGPLQDVTMIEGAPIAFVSFASVQPACRAFELLDGQQVGLHGLLGKGCSQVTLFAMFVCVAVER